MITSNIILFAVIFGVPLLYLIFPVQPKKKKNLYDVHN